MKKAIALIIYLSFIALGIFLSLDNSIHPNVSWLRGFGSCLSFCLALFTCMVAGIK